MSTVIVLLNGPPNCGKDYICESLSEYYGANHCMFKLSLYKETARYYSMETEHFKRLATDRSKKNKPYKCLDGKSPRQAMIHVSEDVIKPQYGQDYFGVLAAKQIKPGALNVFSDSGFIDETFGLLKTVDSNYNLLIQLYRDDCSFEGDSRRYIYPDGVPVVRYDNNLVLSRKDKADKMHEFISMNIYMPENSDER